MMPPDTSLAAAFGLLAAADPHRPAVTCADVSRTRLELDLRTNRLAQAYLSLGVRPGGFVTIALPNGVDFVEAVVAAWKVGAIPQPMAPDVTSGERDALLDLVDPALVVGLSADVVGDRAHLDATPDLAGVADDPLPDIVSPSWKAPTSGGSTGRPKVIVAGEPARIGPLEVYRTLYRITPTTTILTTGPLYHNGPFMNTMLTLLAGGRAVVMPRFDAETCLRHIEADRVTFLYAVPTMMHRISHLPAGVRDRHDVSSLETVLHTAAPCPPWLKREWIEWLGAHRIYEIYGGTEAQAMTALDGAQWLEHPGSVGRAELGEMRALRDDGTPCGVDETGTVWMRRSADAAPTYHYLGADPAPRRDGWETLGDIGRFDAGGFLFVADRQVDLILVGGANVYPAEVEAALERHPHVVSSCVIGLPHTDLGAAPHAIVQLDGTLSEEDLRAFVEGELVRYKRPRSYEFVDYALRDDAGKVRRSELLARRVDGVEDQPAET